MFSRSAMFRSAVVGPTVGASTTTNIMVGPTAGGSRTSKIVAVTPDIPHIRPNYVSNC